MSNGKVTSGTLLRAYLMLRAQKQEHEKAAKEVGEKLAKLEAVMLAKMNGDETDRLCAGGVTAYKAILEKAHVTDRSAFIAFVLAGERTDMITSACSQDAVKEYLEISGSLPPGVALNRIVKVNVRKG